MFSGLRSHRKDADAVGGLLAEDLGEGRADGAADLLGVSGVAVLPVPMAQMAHRPQRT